MNEIDLTKIFKYCPKGTKFYTTIWGEVEFNYINEEYCYPIYIKTKSEELCTLTKDGRFSSFIDAECIIFPSRQQRDWSKFTAPWYKKEKYKMSVPALNNSKITIGTKIRSKINPDVILSIISDDCHGDKFECSNGSVLSFEQIKKYYETFD